MTKTERKRMLREAYACASELRKTGMGYKHIAVKMNDKGYTTPRGRVFTGGNVWNLLTSFKGTSLKKKEITLRASNATDSTDKQEIVKAILKSGSFDSDTKLALCSLVLE